MGLLVLCVALGCQFDQLNMRYISLLLKKDWAFCFPPLRCSINLFSSSYCPPVFLILYTPRPTSPLLRAPSIPDLPNRVLLLRPTVAHCTSHPSVARCHKQPPTRCAAPRSLHHWRAALGSSPPRRTQSWPRSLASASPSSRSASSNPRLLYCQSDALTWRPPWLPHQFLQIGSSAT
jgi:hypothetical protein